MCEQYQQQALNVQFVIENILFYLNLQLVTKTNTGTSIQVYSM